MLSDLEDVQADLLRRLHCTEGHLRGIAAMVECEAACGDVVRQLLAVQAALREVKLLLLRHHLVVCLGGHPRAGPATRAQLLAEVAALYPLVVSGDVTVRIA